MFDRAQYSFGTDARSGRMRVFSVKFTVKYNVSYHKDESAPAICATYCYFKAGRLTQNALQNILCMDGGFRKATRDTEDVLITRSGIAL